MKRRFRLLADGMPPLDLNSRTAYFRAPSGLGMQRDGTYYDVGGFFVRTDPKQIQGQIVGEIVIRDNPYRNYQVLANWLTRAQNIRIAYRPADTEYFADVDLDYLTKTELSGGLWLVCPVSFSRRSPWYTTETQRIDFVNGNGGNKQYTYRYGYRYRLGYSGGEAEVYLEAQTPGGFSFVADGPMIGPYLQLTNADTGEEYGKVSLPGVSFVAGERLEYSSDPLRPYVRKVGPGGVEDLSNSLDLTARNWFTIPVYTRCKVTLHSGTAAVSGVVTLYRYWEAI